MYNGEPAIIDGDLVKEGGDYKRNYGIDNAIRIYLGTDLGYWGNYIEPETSKIKGGLEKLNGVPITSDFLKQHSAKVDELLNLLIANGVAKSIEVESFNTENDRTDYTVYIIMKNGNKYFYDSATGCGEYV